MHYESRGAGTPAFVFVHGYTRDHTDWEPQISALQKRHRVVACDLRGHGLTPGEPQDCSIETYGADVADLVRRLDLTPAVLVGHSLGCRVVLEAARTSPASVAGLVLIDGSCTSSGDPAAAEQAMRQKISTMGYPAFSEERFHDMFPCPNPDAEPLIALSRKVPAAIGTALFPRMSRWDAQYMDITLPAIKAPLMAIQSTYLGPGLKRVSLKPGETSPWLERVRHAVPQARIEVVPGVGHFTQLEAAEKVNRLLEEFMTRCEVT
jgi:pimeloyl-ACP methyl ester carboxylesterase